MADNTQLPASSSQGDVISTEDLGTGVKMSRSKIAIGIKGTDGGDVEAGNPMPTEDVTTIAILQQILMGVQALIIVSKNIDLGLSRICNAHLPTDGDANNPFEAGE